MPKDWEKINDPIHEHENFPNILLDNVSIFDILNKCGVKLTPCQTGEFSHRSKCPLHLEGNERTASFYVSDLTNSFFCFGCNNGGDVIRFVSIYLGMPTDEAMKWIAQASGLMDADFDDLKNNTEIRKRDIEKEVATYIFRAGVFIRDFLNFIKNKEDYDKWCKWADKRFEKMDKMLETLTDKDWEIAEKYYLKIKEYINKTYL